MGRFEKLDNALAEALGRVKSDIKTAPVKPVAKFKGPQRRVPKPASPVQYICGVPVTWEQIGDKKIPVLRTESFYIEYPTPAEKIVNPAGIVRAEYDLTKKEVRMYQKGGKTPSVTVFNRKHNPLPVPKYFSGLEKVEEILDIDLETGEITTELKIDVLPEHEHWLLRLQEFEKQMLARNIGRTAINSMMNRYIENLKKGRGVDLADPRNKVSQATKDAIRYIEQKQAVK